MFKTKAMSEINARLLYTTFPDEASAKEASEKLLDAKLIACANLLPQMASFYRWKGKIERESEVVLLLKTTQDQFNAIDKWMKHHHPYDCPCLLSFSIEQGKAEYLAWIQENVDPE